MSPKKYFTHQRRCIFQQENGIYTRVLSRSLSFHRMASTEMNVFHPAETKQSDVPSPPHSVSMVGLPDLPHPKSFCSKKLCSMLSAVVLLMVLQAFSMMFEIKSLKVEESVAAVLSEGLPGKNEVNIDPYNMNATGCTDIKVYTIGRLSQGLKATLCNQHGTVYVDLRYFHSSFVPSKFGIRIRANDFLELSKIMRTLKTEIYKRQAALTAEGSEEI